jgi:hypothetical protein
MVKELKQLGEHIIALYGHVTGVKRDVDQIRCTQKHIHQDIEKIHGKVDKLLYLIIGALISGSNCLLLEIVLDKASYIYMNREVLSS